ncbi:MAG: hypothetical protein A4E53_04011 [Pelotomaculum sp. PtaB.Bin104]|nr:MAG: hypothetical protein A4E53_04011 [Pelotomaculum sp. PtaB.Bin104]
MRGFLPPGYAATWRAVTPYRSAEHRVLIQPLTNIPYANLIAAYGAYLRGVREDVVFGAEGLTEAERANIDADTLRFLTRLAFGEIEIFREVLQSMRAIQARSTQAQNLGEVLDYHLTELMEEYQGNVYFERALVTVGESRILENIGLLRSAADRAQQSLFDEIIIYQSKQSY